MPLGQGVRGFVGRATRVAVHSFPGTRVRHPGAPIASLKPVALAKHADADQHNNGENYATDSPPIINIHISETSGKARSRHPNDFTPFRL